MDGKIKRVANARARLDRSAELKAKFDQTEKLIDKLANAVSVDLGVTLIDNERDNVALRISDAVRRKIYNALLAALDDELLSLIEEVESL